MDAKRTDHALRHLKGIKPYDGWSADKYINSSGKELVMLRRRNAPLTKSGYLALAYDEQKQQQQQQQQQGTRTGTQHHTNNDTNGCVVGLTSEIGKTETTSFYRAVVLVEKDGTVARDQRDARVSLPNDLSTSGIGSKFGKGKDSNSNAMKEDLDAAREQNRRDRDNAREAIGRRQQGAGSGARAGTGSGARAGAASSAPGAPFSAENLLGNIDMSDEQTSELAKLGLMFIGVVTILRIISSSTFVFKAVVLPIGILYGMMTCPANDTFDPKKELKRVLRGQHLPEGHQDKPPDDWFSRTVARVTASVVAEASTAFGYEVSFTSFGGAFTLSTVLVPTLNMELYWIGAFGSWRYIMKRKTQIES